MNTTYLYATYLITWFIFAGYVLWIVADRRKLRKLQKVLYPDKERP